MQSREKSVARRSEAPAFICIGESVGGRARMARQAPDARAGSPLPTGSLWSPIRCCCWRGHGREVKRLRRRRSHVAGRKGPAGVHCDDAWEPRGTARCSTTLSFRQNIATGGIPARGSASSVREGRLGTPLAGVALLVSERLGGARSRVLLCAEEDVMSGNLAHILVEAIAPRGGAGA